MENFKIGNWYITDEAIEWRDNPDEDPIYWIDFDVLLNNHDGRYSWLVHMIEKTWLKREDIYSLNSALVYAIEKNNLPFDKLSFIKTFELQESMLKRKEENSKDFE